MIKRNPSKRKRLMAKKKISLIAERMMLPGESHIFDNTFSGKPPCDGQYLVYYEPSPPRADSNIKRSAGMEVANYTDGKWGINYKVLLYFGPLPVLSLPHLLEYQPPYKVNQIFYTGTLEQGANLLYDSGPHMLYIIAFLQPAKKDHFIFCFDSEEKEPYPIAKVNLESKAISKWIGLKPKAIKKYCKMMDHLRLS